MAAESDKEIIAGEKVVMLLTGLAQSYIFKRQFIFLTEFLSNQNHGFKHSQKAHKIENSNYVQMNNTVEKRIV